MPPIDLKNGNPRLDQVFDNKGDGRMRWGKPDQKAGSAATEGNVCKGGLPKR